MADEMDLDIMATELAGQIMRAHDEEPVYGSDIIALVRAVVRDELRRAQQRAEAAAKLATQEAWDSDEFKAQVDALREGRMTVASLPPTASHRHHSVVTRDAEGHPVLLRNKQPTTHCSVCGTDTTRRPEEPTDFSRCPNECCYPDATGVRPESCDNECCN